MKTEFPKIKQTLYLDNNYVLDATKKLDYITALTGGISSGATLAVYSNIIEIPERCVKLSQDVYKIIM